MQHDNGSFIAKQKMRRAFLREVGKPLSVLEGFTGEGKLGATCWLDAAVAATIDIDETKALAASKRRPRWACYCGDTEKALRSGWMGHRGWDVVDLDAYGTPWPFLKALLTSEREWLDATTVFLTDGYFARRGMSAPDKSLWPDADKRMIIPAAAYDERVSSRITEWCRTPSLSIASLSSVVSRRMRLWRLDLQKSLG